MLFEFMTNYISEISTVLISLMATIMPIPIIIRKIVQNINQGNKAAIIIKNTDGMLLESDVYKDKLELILDSATNSEEGEKQSNPDATPPSPQPHDFPVTYLSKKSTLNELHEKRNTDKALKKISFTLAVIMSVIGTLILFFGILISLFTEKEVGWITTSSGAIIELVAGVYFWLVNRTMKEVNDNSEQLKKTEDLFAAIELAEKISDPKTKDETYKNMINKLLPENHK